MSVEDIADVVSNSTYKEHVLISFLAGFIIAILLAEAMFMIAAAYIGVIML